MPHRVDQADQTVHRVISIVRRPGKRRLERLQVAGRIINAGGTVAEWVGCAGEPIDRVVNVGGRVAELVGRTHHIVTGIARIDRQVGVRAGFKVGLAVVAQDQSGDSLVVRDIQVVSD